MPLSEKQIKSYAARDERVLKAVVKRKANGASFRQLADTKLEPNFLRGALRRLIAKKRIVMQGVSRAAKYFDKQAQPAKAIVTAKRPAKKTVGKVARKKRAKK